MNKKQLYESIMRNIASEVKKQLNETHYEEIDEDEFDDMSDLQESWENIMYGWISNHINETAVFVAMLLISNKSWDEQQTERWTESVMNILAEQNVELIVDEVFIQSIANWLSEYAAADFYNKALAELKNVEYYEQNTEF